MNDQAEDSRESRNGVQVLEPGRDHPAPAGGGLVRRAHLQRARGPGRSAAHHGAPHPLRAGARGVRGHRRGHGAPAARAGAAAAGGGQPPGPAQPWSSPTSSASPRSSTRPWTWRCSTGCTCSSSPRSRRRSAPSWSSRGSAPGSRRSARPTARRCWRSSRSTSSGGACRASWRRRARHQPVTREELLQGARRGPRAPASRTTARSTTSASAASASPSPTSTARMASVSVPMPAARFYEDADTVVAALAARARRDPGGAAQRPDGRGGVP